MPFARTSKEILSLFAYIVDEKKVDFKILENGMKDKWKINNAGWLTIVVEHFRD